MIPIVLKKIPKIIAILSFFLCVTLLVFSIISISYLPDKISTQSKEKFSLATPFPMVAKIENEKASFQLFGCIPISNANVQWETPPNLVVGGVPFGIKVLAKGVLVVGISQVETKEGTCCPAKIAGLEKGDLILKVNGNSISTNSGLQEVVAKGSGKPLTLTVEHNGKTKTMELKPVLSKEGVYRIGLWVRDSTAGLGTLTFYHPQTGVYGGLGHGVCDSDTGQLVSLSAGEIVNAKIKGIQKGTAGTPGELKGSLISNSHWGNLQINCNHGVFGTLDTPLSGTSFPLGYQQEVEKGEAVLYSSVSDTLTGYTCRIEKINGSNRTTQNMVIQITDPALLSLTGGIVQGMSGSPIVQKGKLVGAITHVFVNNPAKGYAVFAETMWQTAKTVTKTTQLSKAS